MRTLCKIALGVMIFFTACTYNIKPTGNYESSVNPAEFWSWKVYKITQVKNYIFDMAVRNPDLKAKPQWAMIRVNAETKKIIRYGYHENGEFKIYRLKNGRYVREVKKYDYSKGRV